MPSRVCERFEPFPNIVRRGDDDDGGKVFRKAGDMEDNSNAVRLKHFFAVLLGRGKWLSKIMQVELRRPSDKKGEKHVH